MMVYALLEHNLEYGQECIAALKEEGAPDIKKAEEKFILDKGRRDSTITQGSRTDKHLSNRKKFQGGGTGASYLVRRLVREAKDDLD